MERKNIEYGNESINITKDCCKYLIENNFHENDELTNLNLLENSLINFSIIKLIDWNIDIEKIGITNFDNLKELLIVIDNIIPTDKEKESYFSQYVHCILYVTEKINKQPEIKWNKNKDINEEIIYTFKDNILKEITTSQNINIHSIPVKLLNEVKSLFQTKEKNPVLKK